MFEISNIGGKIKYMATVLLFIGVIGSVLIGFSGFVIGCAEGDVGLALFAIAYAVIGAIGSWVWCWLMYGFGQLVENSDKLFEEEEKTE